MRPDTISALYGTIVAQARMPCFYQDYAVADTVNGRFDLIVLHLSLVLDRLTGTSASEPRMPPAHLRRLRRRDTNERAAGEPALRELWQGLFDHFCRDMDHNLREMGVSDLKVPKEMRRMGEAFYGRAQAYRAALAATDEGALVEAVARNIYGGAPAAPDAPHRLAVYMKEAVRHLAAQDANALAAGTLHFPDPKEHFKMAG